MSEFFFPVNQMQDWVIAEIIWGEFPELTFKEFFKTFKTLTGSDPIQI